MELLSQFQDELKCALCQDYSHQAVETTCCKRMYCESCLTNYATDKIDDDRSCPNCAVPYIAYRINDLGRRMIGRIPFVCTNECGLSLKRSERETHLAACPNRMYKCPKKDCGAECLADHYMEHVSIEHRHEFLNNAKYLFEASEPDVKPGILTLCPFLGCEVVDTKANITSHLMVVHGQCMVKAEKDVLVCPLCAGFSGVRAEILSHLGSEHRTELCVAISDQIQSVLEATTSATVNSDLRVTVNSDLPAAVNSDLPAAVNSDFQVTVNSDLPSTSNASAVNFDLPNMFNDMKNPVRFGQNGKVYCGKASVIGPADSTWVCEYPGLNCRYCMEMDCKVRHLPPGCLVNALGVNSEPKFEAIGNVEGGAVLVKAHYSCGGGCTVRTPCRYCTDLTNVCSRVEEYHGSADKLVVVNGDQYPSAIDAWPHPSLKRPGRRGHTNDPSLSQPENKKKRRNKKCNEKNDKNERKKLRKTRNGNPPFDKTNGKLANERAVAVKFKKGYNKGNKHKDGKEKKGYRERRNRTGHREKGEPQ